MSYKTRVDPLVTRQILSWQLSDFLFTDVQMRLYQTLPISPTKLLQRTFDPIDGLVYPFELIDPDNRMCVHSFLFQVVYGQDEETLWVVRGLHLRMTGL